ncbi:MAG: helix-turn-helix domain-containing protein [Pseudonocardiaceae bacterium]
MTSSRYVEHGAIVSGSAAYLLSRLLRAASVTSYIRGAAWLHGDDFGHAVHTIHQAARAWQLGVELGQRDNAPRHEPSHSEHGTISTDEAAGMLHLSRRRTQELAQQGHITARRNGRSWELNSASVGVYQRHQQQKRTSAV